MTVLGGKNPAVSLANTKRMSDPVARRKALAALADWYERNQEEFVRRCIIREARKRNGKPVQVPDWVPDEHIAKYVQIGTTDECAAASYVREMKRRGK